MMIITSGLLTSFVGTWVVIEVMACKSKDATPPPPVCEDGDTFDDDFVEEQELNQAKEDDEHGAPSTVYVEVMVVFDINLYNKIGNTYKNGRWDPAIGRNDSSLVLAEVKLYARKFLSAVNIKFQGQFNNPKIKFVLREVFKIKDIFKRSSCPWGPYVTFV